ncbi:MAG: pyridoxal phosphate-dependent aminotransferase [Bacteroidetes bacterium]|nr:pyridoxal phosphate-dependent aminotransferase [Bacteroidota bacterium]
MPKISLKGEQMPSSPIRKLVPFAEKAIAEGKKVYHLNIGQPDIETPSIALDAVRNFDLNVLEYSHSAGFQSYREKLAGYYQKHQITLDANQIIVTTGGSEALMFAMGSIADPGDEIIIPEPFYANYNAFSIASGATVVPVPSSIENNFALPPISEFEKLITTKTKAILICNPGNPTGYLYSLDELEILADICIRHDLFLLADEVYREFAYDGHQHHSILTIERLQEHAVVIDSVSKRYSMCGARIGCLISKNKAFMQTAMKFAQARLSPPTLEQVAAEAAIGTPDSYFKAVNEEYTMRRNLLVNGLQKIEGVKVAKPNGAFYCMAALPIDDAEVFAQWLLESFDDQGETVMVAPAGGFYATPGSGKNEVRIAYVLEKTALKRAVEILEKAIPIYQKQMVLS